MTFPVFDIPAQRALLDPDAPALVDGGSPTLSNAVFVAVGP